jgi:alpha-L-rhamnosidase
MKRPVLVLLFFSLFACEKETAPVVPSGMMVEFIREPEKVRILDLKPEFTWIVPPEAGIQSAYQILVASSEINLKNNKADIWNSGKVLSSRSNEVEYGGGSLSPDQNYYWKVRIWNNSDKSAKYSAIQSFITGNPDGYSTTPDMFVSAMQHSEKLIKLAEGYYFADFGRDAFGTIVLDMLATQPDTVLIRLGEKIIGGNHIDRNPGGSVRYQLVILFTEQGSQRYTIKPSQDIRNTGPAAIHLPDSFGIITPFRYCEIENPGINLKPENIFRKVYNYYFDDNASDFTSSDTILNRIWDISKYSIKETSFTGVYIDGDRERIPYEGDAYINQLGHYYSDREYAMARVTNEYFINHPTWPTEWILHTVLLFYNDYMFTGNSESLKENYLALKYKTLNSLADTGGLIISKNATDETMKNLGFINVRERIRDIVDWPPAQKDTGWKLATAEGERDGYDMVEINTVVNAFYYRNLVLMSVIAGIIGEKNDSVYFYNQADKTRKSFNTRLLDSVKGYYVDGVNSAHSSLHANMMALTFGLVPDEYKRSVTDFIKSRGMACSVYGSQYLLEGLYKAGEADYAFSLLTSTSDRSWWNMIRCGSTITMEAWDKKYKPNSDWNHAWGAAPANIIPGYLWGISPAEPGYARAVIKPQLSSLKFSKITVPTIRGSIIAEFNDTGKSKEYLITIPGNMQCDFIAPKGKVIKLNPGLNRIVL